MAESQLEQLYFKPGESASLGGVQHLIDRSRVKRKQVSQWLPYQDAYTLHKPAKHH